MRLRRSGTPAWTSSSFCKDCSAAAISWHLKTGSTLVATLMHAVANLVATVETIIHVRAFY